MQFSANQSYEMSLTSTLVMNAVVALVIILLFPLLRFLFPVVYSPLHYQTHENTGLLGEIFWFVDVFIQPIQVYAYRGNMTLLFVLLQTMLLLLFCFIAALSGFVLIPTYLYGHDQYMNQSYLTFWSKLSLVHLEEGSPLFFIPLLVLVLVCLAVMFTYAQFNTIYISLRYKTFKRVIPQNYVLMLSNIPKDINTFSELLQLLQPFDDGILAVLPSPVKSNRLYSDASKLLKYVGSLDVLSINQQKLNAATLAKKVYELPQKSALANKQLMKMIAENDENSHEYFFKYQAAKQLKRRLFEDLKAMHIRPKYFENQRGYPPQMLLPMQNLLDYRFGGACKLNGPLTSAYAIDTVLDEGIKRYFKEQYLYEKTKRLDVYALSLTSSVYSEDQLIGRFAFVICNTQKNTAAKYSSLLTIDYQCPKAEIAPAPYLINWKNLSISTANRNFRWLMFAITLTALFVIYFYIQALIMGQLQKVSDDWILQAYNSLRPANCIVLSKENINAVYHGFCSIVYSVSSTIVTFVPTLINSLLMSLLPFFLDWTIDILGFPTQQQKQHYSFVLLFIFLILIQGIVQVALPQAIQIDTGEFDLQILFQQSFNGFLASLGENIPKQMFVYINYIIAKYFLFPALGLLNIPNAFFCLIYLLFSKNSMQRTNRFQTFIFKYPKQLAYITHMVVVSFIFCIVAPITNIIVLVTYLMMVVTDRYYVLYIAGPDETTELSHQSKLMKSVINALFTGLVFMLVACFSFFLQYKGWQYILARVLTIVCLIGCIAYKIQYDARFNRAMNELAHGNYAFKHNLLLNVADNFNGFENATLENRKDRVIQETKSSYLPRNNCLSQWIKRNYCDFKDLPVNYTIFQNLKQKETVSYILDELETSENQLVCEYELAQDDVKAIYQHYSHPAVAYTYGNQLELE